MGLRDKRLENKILISLKNLEKLVDYIGPTIIRHLLNEHILIMRLALKDFNQDTYEKLK
jgi:hypothetical protein